VSRPLLFILTGAVLSGLSCAVTSPIPSLTSEPSLPHVSAPPPAAGEPSQERQVAAIERYLLTRRMGLASREITSLAHTIVEQSRHYDLDPALMMAVMHVESRFNSFAVSPVGALGLMQILPETGQEMALKHGVAWHGRRTLFDPEINVKLGIAYLRELTDRYGNISTALAAYNWGPGRIDRRIRRGSRLPVEYPRLVLGAHTDRWQADRES